MIFLTVGTQLPFDRLVRAVDEAIGSGAVQGRVFAQIGSGSYRPGNMEYVAMLDRGEFAQRLLEAEAIVSHAGMGTIISALEAGKGVLVMPRSARLDEIVNDHQVATARKFESLGHVLVAYDESQIPAKMGELRLFSPVRRRANTGPVVEAVAGFFRHLAGQ